MPVAEPTSPLWLAVRPYTQWPTSDEDRVIDAGIAWKEAGVAFRAAGAPINNGLTSWVDDVGIHYKATVDRLTQEAHEAAELMTKVGELTVVFGNAVEWAKEEITENIDINEIAYDTIVGLAPRSEAELFVQQMAEIINQLLDRLASQIAAQGGGVDAGPLPAIDRVPHGSLPAIFPGWRSPTQDLDNDTARGLARELTVARATGGTVIGDPGRPGLPIRNRDGQLATDVDVIGANGEFIAVGGVGKAGALEGLGEKLQALKDEATEQGVRAEAWFDRTDLPQSVIDKAAEVLHPENVHLF